MRAVQIALQRRKRSPTGSVGPDTGRKAATTGRPVWLLTILLGFGPGLSQPVFGVGYRLPNQDPVGIARGNAFVATADNPSAIYYNPAGITQLAGASAQAGVYLIRVGVSYDGSAGSTRNQSDIQPVPQVYSVYSPADSRFSFGLGVYVPYGLSMEYPENSPLRTAAIEGSLLYAAVNPVVAWKIHPRLSLAIGPTLNYSQVEFTRGISPPPATDSFRFKGDGFDAGFNAGVRWEPLDKWAFGAMYHSATTIDYQGHSETSPSAPPPYYPRTSTGAQIHFPQFVVGGLSFRPTPDWNLEFDLDWTDWHSALQIPFTGPPLPAFPLSGISSFMYEFGLTRQLGRGYFCSVGYIYSEASGPDSTFNPVIPDANLHLGGFGVGHRGRRWDWTLGCQLAVGARDVQNDTANPAANGSYHIFNQAVNLSACLHF
jgi:long-chain fatty acid transport protein